MKHKYMIFNSFSKDKDLFTGDTVDAWSVRQRAISDILKTSMPEMYDEGLFKEVNSRGGRPIFLHVAPTSCLGFSPRGAREGNAHKSCKGYN
eukprot:3840742-Pyramimonas_sp.AAC.1